MEKQNKESKESFWEKGSFIESMSSEDMKDKMRTFHMKHDEEMNYNCTRCNKKISAHNRDWHGNMCDDCFDKTYFPEKRRMKKEQNLQKWMQKDA